MTAGDHRRWQVFFDQPPASHSIWDDMFQTGDANAASAFIELEYAIIGPILLGIVIAVRLNGPSFAGQDVAVLEFDRYLQSFETVLCLF